MKSAWVLLLSAGLVAFAQAAGDYRFFLDGKVVEPRIESVQGEPGYPAPGDIAWIAKHPLRLAGPGEYRFRKGEMGKLFGKLPGWETEACVGVVVSEDWNDGRSVLNDPLTRLAAAEKATLRSVFLDARPDDWNRAMADVPWGQVVLTVGGRIASKKEPKRLPDLPPELPCLFLDVSTNSGIEDLSTLLDLADLEFLQLDYGTPLDLRLLSKAKHLRTFRASGADLSGLAAIRQWKQLRVLDLAYCEEVKDLSFLGSQVHLRSLDLSGTGVADLGPLAKLTSLVSLECAGCAVTDLTPLGKLPKLEYLNANSSRVEKLPAAPQMPALRHLVLLTTPTPTSAVVAFRKAVPHCQTVDSWHELLLLATKESDRLRVRSGGTCHRNPAREETLFEIKNRAEVQGLLAKLTIDDDESGFHCMCCGEPTFEFYQGEKLVAMLGFHHGRSFRWADGDWPGDACLTEAAAETVCRFLDQHGVPGPLAEREAELKRRAASSRHRAACERFASPQQLATWREHAAKHRDQELVDAVAQAWPDPAERAARLFSLHGAVSTQRWNLATGIDEPLAKLLLPVVPDEAVASMLDRNPCPPEILQGVARQVFFDRGGELAKTLPDQALARLAAWALAHPRADNRESTLFALAAMKRAAADRILLDFLRQPPQPRPLPPEDEVEPGGSVTFPPRPKGAPKEPLERTLAAWLLAPRASAEAIRAIETYAVEAPEAEREVLQQVLRKAREPKS